MNSSLNPPEFTPPRARFTMDGSAALETHLAQLCERIRTGVLAIVPRSRIDALVLGGGYGRGEGGVLRTDSGDAPYNDFEFYVFLKGNRLLNQRRFASVLNQFGEQLSPAAGMHVEFKVDSIHELRRRPVSMFTYDLVSRHRIVIGNETCFDGCEHHLHGDAIPLSEATRLLFNRSSGLLLAKDYLQRDLLTDEQVDFVGRNLAKAQLALGDAVLTASGKYHWSCRERHSRLLELVATSASGAGISSPAPRLDDLRAHHAAGIDFKLHPRRIVTSVEQLRTRHAGISALASELWLWVEQKRLGKSFASPRDYAFSSVNKCPETSRWRNCLLNWRTFGASFDSQLTRYPRERLFNALSLLLWDGFRDAPETTRVLQKQLRTASSEWTGLLAAYKHLWPSYG